MRCPNAVVQTVTEREVRFKNWEESWECVRLRIDVEPGILFHHIALNRLLEMRL